jgi:hypothetical protein
MALNMEDDSSKCPSCDVVVTVRRQALPIVRKNALGHRIFNDGVSTAVVSPVDKYDSKSLSVNWREWKGRPLSYPSFYYSGIRLDQCFSNGRVPNTVAR